MSTHGTQKRSELVYFCDETSFIGEEHMAVAGFAILRGRIPEVVRKLRSINEDKKARGEIKWQNTRAKTQ